MPGPNELTRAVAGAGRGAGPAVHPAAGVAAGRGGCPGVGQRDTAAGHCDRRGHLLERRVRVRAGNAGRAGGRGAGRLPARARPGAAGRDTAGDRGPPTGARRCPAHRGRGKGLRRRSADHRHPGSGPVHPDRRVRAGDPLGRPSRPDRATATSQRRRVQRHHLHRRRSRALVTSTGMGTELGRIAALSQRAGPARARWSTRSSGRPGLSPSSPSEPGSRSCRSAWPPG